MRGYCQERVNREARLQVRKSLLTKEDRRGAATQVGYVLPTLRGWLLCVESKDLVALCHSFCIFIFLLQYIHSYNHSLITFAGALLHVFIALGSVGGTSLGCQAEIRTQECLTASQRTTIWATLHPKWASLHPLIVLNHIEPLVHTEESNSTAALSPYHPLHPILLLSAGTYRAINTQLEAL